MKRLFAVGLVLVVVVLVLWWWLTPRPGQGSKNATDQGSVTAHVSKRAPKGHQTKKPPQPRAPLPSLSDDDKASVYEQLQPPGSSRIRCAAPESYTAGVYRPMGSRQVQFALVQNGQLTATVTTPDGEATLMRDLKRTGTLRWQGAGSADWTNCELTEPKRVLVSGRVLWADGSPAADHPLSTCDFGEVVVTDEAGAFEFSTPEGRECYLIGIVDSDAGLGRSPTVTVDISADARGVEIVLPADEDLFDDATIELAAAQLSKMVNYTLAEEQKRHQALLDVDLEGLSEDATQVIRTMLQEDRWVLESQQEMARLTSPDSYFEDKVEAVRLMFLQAYQ